MLWLSLCSGNLTMLGVDLNLGVFANTTINLKSLFFFFKFQNFTLEFFGNLIFETLKIYFSKAITHQFLTWKWFYMIWWLKPLCSFPYTTHLWFFYKNQLKYDLLFKMSRVCKHRHSYFVRALVAILDSESVWTLEAISYNNPWNLKVWLLFKFQAAKVPVKEYEFDQKKLANVQSHLVFSC